MKGLLETLDMTSRMVEIQDIFDEKIGDYRKLLNKVETLVCEKQEKPSAQQARQLVQSGFERFCEEISK